MQFKAWINRSPRHVIAVLTGLMVVPMTIMGMEIEYERRGDVAIMAGLAVYPTTVLAGVGIGQALKPHGVAVDQGERDSGDHVAAIPSQASPE